MTWLAAVVGLWPVDGLDFVVLKRVNLLIVITACGLLIWRGLSGARAAHPRRYRAVVGCLAALASVNYLNYFSFHGERTFLHLHDLAHYYLGGKYHAELGYDHLYTAMLRAEAELYENRFRALEARDLETNRLVHIRTLLQRSDPVRERFREARWDSFKKDVAFFHDSLGPHWAGVLRDHGYNPSPVWTLIGSVLANRVPAGSRTGITLLSLLDPLLLIGMFGAIAWAFGLDTTLWSATYFCVIFGGTFGWTGGSFLRHLWLAALLIAVCLLQRRRYGLAGGLLALATALRIFPLFFALALVMRPLRSLLNGKRPDRGIPRSVAAFVATGVLLAAMTGWLPSGYDSWRSFSTRIERQLETVSPNVVGLTEVLTYRAGVGLVTAEEFDRLAEHRKQVHRAQLVTVLPVALLAVFLLAGRVTETGAVALGIPLILVVLNLAGYYWVFLILLLLVNRDSPFRLSWLFAAEAVPYALMYFEPREAFLYVSWTVALGALMVALYWRRLRREVRVLDRWARTRFAPQRR